MRIASAFALGTLVLSGGCQDRVAPQPDGTAQSARIARIEDFAGIDTREMTDGQRLELDGLVQNLKLRDGSELPSPICATCYIWPPEPADVNLIVLQTKPLTKSPGSSLARVLIVDGSDVVVWQDELSFYKVNVGVLTCDRHPEGFPYFTLQLEGWLATYAIQNHKVHLIRSQGDRGVVPWLGFGRENDRLPNEEWIECLSSADRLVCLKTLASLPTNPRELIGDPAVTDRLTQLSLSADQWTSEGASSYLAILENPDRFSWILDSP
jgi:hypothetical protein